MALAASLAGRLSRRVMFRLPAHRLENAMDDHPVLGYFVWLLLIGAVFAWEGLALSGISGSVPTLSATFRAIMRYPPGRWALFALWLWLGWHLFVRGWHFLLRA
ncbi:MAG TPA: DUF6186 family protein [Streptosporangiaceae bacterium]|jgi:hypothetical protein|nr:DUF6186 family protein [Streptosporangiaceae bacterium]